MMKALLTVLVMVLSLQAFAQTDSAQYRQKQYQQELDSIRADLREWTADLKQYLEETDTEKLSHELDRQMDSLKLRLKRLDRYFADAEVDNGLSESQRKKLQEAEQAVEKARKSLEKGLTEMKHAVDKAAEELKQRINKEEEQK